MNVEDWEAAALHEIVARVEAEARRAAPRWRGGARRPHAGGRCGGGGGRGAADRGLRRVARSRAAAARRPIRDTLAADSTPRASPIGAPARVRLDAGRRLGSTAGACTEAACPGTPLPTARDARAETAAPARPTSGSATAAPAKTARGATNANSGATRSSPVACAPRCVSEMSPRTRPRSESGTSSCAAEFNSTSDELCPSAGAERRRRRRPRATRRRASSPYPGRYSVHASWLASALRRDRQPREQRAAHDRRRARSRPSRARSRRRRGASASRTSVGTPPIQVPGRDRHGDSEHDDADRQRRPRRERGESLAQSRRLDVTRTPAAAHARAR